MHKAQIAQENFERARDAVDTYLTKVSEDELLNTPGMQPLRKDLLQLALKYYQDFVAELENDPGLEADLASAYMRVGKITRKIGSADDAFKAYSKAIEILVLKALANQGRGNTGEALSALGRALSQAEPEGYVRTFVDEGPPMARLLRAFGGQRTAVSREGAIVGWQLAIGM